jgi:hypothetical protein
MGQISWRHTQVTQPAMEDLPLVGAESPVTWAGALSLEVHAADGGSVQPYRLNHEDAPLYHTRHNGSESVFARAATPAGVRLVVLTTAEALELTFCWRGELAQSENMSVDLCLGNEVRSSQRAVAEQPPQPAPLTRPRSRPTH